MRRVGTGDASRMRLGTSATDLYGLSLSEISKLNKDVLEELQDSSGNQSGLYDEEDNTDECD